MNKTLIITTANGFLVVLLGAFGTHGLENLLSPESLATWNTAVQYHMFHAAALFGTGLLIENHPGIPLLSRSAILFLIGIVLFSGSLYLLALTGFSILGMITPLGGLAFLGGWGCLFTILLKGLDRA